jgi:HAD superfamily hydrolase (TIGR01509 family)
MPPHQISPHRTWQHQDHDALLFDCDGTLADTMPAHYRAWLAVTVSHGIAFDEERFYGLGGRPTRDILAALAAEAGVTLDLDRGVEAKEAAFLAQLDGVSAIDPVIDVVLRTRGRVPMAVVTGGHRAVCDRILAHLGIAAAFSTVVASEDTTRHKPEPEPFLEAARRLSARPERCVVWEDSDLGIEAARRAGMEWIDVRAFHRPRRVSRSEEGEPIRRVSRS